MCLAQFAAANTYNRGNENCFGEDENEFVHELDSDIKADSDETTHTNVIKLQNGLGQMRKRKRKAVIQRHNFNIEKEPEKSLQITYHAISIKENRREITRQLHVI